MKIQMIQGSELLIMAVCLMFLTAGCALSNNLPSVCDDVPETDNSFICETVQKMNMSAESMANLIVDVNIGAIMFGAYTPGDMYFYTRKMRESLSQPLSYRAAVALFLKYGDSMRKRAMERPEFNRDKYSDLLLIIVSRHLMHFKSDLIISEFDRGLLLRLLDYMDSQTEAIWALTA